MEQRVWLHSGGSTLFPNLYITLVGHPGTGKTRSIRTARNIVSETPEPHIAPTSMTAASMVDALVESKRFRPAFKQGEDTEYNSMLICADELGAFIHKWDDEMIAMLSAFYDVDPYGHWRRGQGIRIKIKRPQLNVLCGSTPSNLLKLMPEGAWEQGFTSRIIMVFSDERTVQDDFAFVAREIPTDLIHDLTTITKITGAFKVTAEYQNAVNAWRANGEGPVPKHPKLMHYNTRRRAHFYKLSMVAAIERSDILLLDREVFNRAMGWLIEAEYFMPDVFRAGVTGADAAAQQEIAHFVMAKGRVGDQELIRFISLRVPAHSVLRTREIMAMAGTIKVLGHKGGICIWGPGDGKPLSSFAPTNVVRIPGITPPDGRSRPPSPPEET